MRVLGLDYGERRIGVAISDPSGTLASPLETIPAGGLGAIDAVASLLHRLAVEEAAPASIVVGLPSKLDGSPSEMTDRVRAFAAALANRTHLPIAFQDERLSSQEAEGRLAVRHRSWRRRKALVDSAAAAVILQDYLDARREKEPPFDATRRGEDQSR